jgi:hypothetical protein
MGLGSASKVLDGSLQEDGHGLIYPNVRDLSAFNLEDQGKVHMYS